MVIRVADNNPHPLLIALGVLFVTLIGVILSNFLFELLGPITVQNDFLTTARLSYLIQALTWFLISLIAYFGTKTILAKGERMGIGIFFVVLWIACTLGVVFGSIIWIILKQQQVLLNETTLFDPFFQYLAITLGPTFAAILAFNNKPEI